jgi:hypothetical protein
MVVPESWWPTGQPTENPSVMAVLASFAGTEE